MHTVTNMSLSLMCNVFNMTRRIAIPSTSILVQQCGHVQRNQYCTGGSKSTNDDEAPLDVTSGAEKKALLYSTNLAENAIKETSTPHNENTAKEGTKDAEKQASRTAFREKLHEKAIQYQKEVDADEIEMQKTRTAVPDRLLQRLVVECQSNNQNLLKSYAKFITMVCENLEIDLGGIEYPPRHHQRVTLLKSVHVHKKHRVQYEIRTHLMRVTMFHLTGSTADTFLEYIQRMCPENVGVKTTEYELVKFPKPLQDLLNDIRQKKKEQGKTNNTDAGNETTL